MKLTWLSIKTVKTNSTFKADMTSCLFNWYKTKVFQMTLLWSHIVTQFSSGSAAALISERTNTSVSFSFVKGSSYNACSECILLLELMGPGAECKYSGVCVLLWSFTFQLFCKSLKEKHKYIYSMLHCMVLHKFGIVIRCNIRNVFTLDVNALHIYPFHPLPSFSTSIGKCFTIWHQGHSTISQDQRCIIKAGNVIINWMQSTAEHCMRQKTKDSPSHLCCFHPWFPFSCQPQMIHTHQECSAILQWVYSFSTTHSSHFAIFYSDKKQQRF